MIDQLLMTACRGRGLHPVKVFRYEAPGGRVRYLVRLSETNVLAVEPIVKGMDLGKLTVRGFRRLPYEPHNVDVEWIIDLTDEVFLSNEVKKMQESAKNEAKKPVRGRKRGK